MHTHPIQATVVALLAWFFVVMSPPGYAAPISDHPQFQQAVQAYHAGQLDEAEQLWKSLLARYPRQPSILNNLAVIAAARGDINSAIDLLDTALSLYQSIRSVYDNLSNVYAYMAAEPYQQALALDFDEQESLRLILIDREQPAQPATQFAYIERILSSTMVDQPFVKEPVVAQVTEYTDFRADIVALLEAWADAWRRQDVASYVASYVHNYQPPGLTHKQWYEKRAERLTSPEFIEVSFSNVTIQAEPKRENTMAVVFLQSYRSNQLKSTVRKKLVVEKVLGVWKIIDERVLR